MLWYPDSRMRQSAGSQPVPKRCGFGESWPEVRFDRYGDRYWSENRRTIRSKAYCSLAEVEQNITSWTSADSQPSNYEPEGRVFESLRAHHKRNQFKICGETGRSLRITLFAGTCLPVLLVHPIHSLLGCAYACG